MSDTTNTKRFSIVLARIEDEMQVTGEWTREYGDGVNYMPKLRRQPKAVAVMWLRDAKDSDVPKARAFAASEGYTLVMVPRADRDPLTYAKRQVLNR